MHLKLNKLNIANRLMADQRLKNKHNHTINKHCLRNRLYTTKITTYDSRSKLVCSLCF